MWSVYRKVLENRTRTTDKLEAWHRLLQDIIFRPYPDFDTFLKVISEESIFIKIQIKKHLAMVEREERINRIVFNMAGYHGPIEYLEAIARASNC